MTAFPALLFRGGGERQEMSISKKLQRPPDLAAPAQPSRLVLHPGLPQPVREGIEQALRAAGADLSAEPVHFAHVNALPKVNARTVALYDGTLSPALGDLLARPTPALLCAQPDPSAPPSGLDLRLIAALLTGRPLRPSSATWRRAIVGSLQEAEKIMEQLSSGATKRGASAAGSLAADVAYELIANALLDAPADADGKPRYAHRRADNPTIAAEDACGFAAGLDDHAMYISVVDRFGRMSASPLVRNLRAWGEQAKLHTDGGGAGLGYRRILEGSDVLAVRVQPGKRTEVLAAVALKGPRRRAHLPKSIFYWQDRRGDGQ